MTGMSTMIAVGKIAVKKSQDLSTSQSNMRNPVSASTAFYLQNYFGAFNSGLIFTGLYAYYVRNLGLSPFQLVLIGTLLMITGMLFEVPTGIVADLYSRKLSVIIGGVLTGVCYLLVGTFSTFTVVLLAAFIEAIGGTFISGALDAWISDEVGTEQAGRIFLRAAQWGTPAYLLGIAGSILLSTLYNYQVPILVGATLWLITSLSLFWIMPETAFVRPSLDRISYRFSLSTELENALRTFRNGILLIRTNRILSMIFLAELFVGAFLESFFRIYRVQFLTNLTLPLIYLPGVGKLDDVVWFGILDGLGSLVSIFSIEIALRRMEHVAEVFPTRLLIALYAVILIAVLFFAFTTTLPIAIVAWLVIKALLELADPVTKIWVNRQISSDVRATVLSMRSQINTVGQLGGGLSVGLISNWAGLRIALAAAGLLLLPLLVIFRSDSTLHETAMEEVITN